MNELLESTLIKLHQLISPVSEDWMLIGTTSLYLQGYPVTPHDIDILCSSEVAEQIGQILLPHLIVSSEPVSKEKFRSNFSRYCLDGITIELMGDLEVYTTDGWIKLKEQIHKGETLLFKGHLFKVPSKNDQFKIYQLFGRQKDQKVLEILSC